MVSLSKLGAPACLLARGEKAVPFGKGCPAAPGGFVGDAGSTR
jgi:hypothetical protein